MRYITWVVVSLTLALTVPDTASAQRHYGGYRGGWNGGYRPYYGSRYYGGFGVYPYFSLGWGSYGYPGYSYSYPPTYYSYPQTTYVAPRSSLYFDPSMNSSSIVDPTAMTANRARVEVIVSDPNAELYIQGQLMPGMGTTRDFTSPDLEQGKAFRYTITVKNSRTGLKPEETRNIEVRAGAQVVVDFTKQDIQRMPLPNTADPLLEKPK